jgi:hypothetical protein
MDESVDLRRMPIEQVYQPIDFEVKGQQTFKLTVPITIVPHALLTDSVFEFVLCFRGPNGNQFGDQIPMKLQVGAPKVEVSEITLTKLAIKLYDSKAGKSYEECLQVAEQVNGDEKKARLILSA